MTTLWAVDVQYYGRVLHTARGPLRIIATQQAIAWANNKWGSSVESLFMARVLNFLPRAIHAADPAQLALVP